MSTPELSPSVPQVQSALDTRINAGSAFEQPHDNSIALMDVVSALLRRRRWVVGIPLLVTAVIGVKTFLAPRSYATEVAFTPSSSSATSGAAQLAAQFGLGAGGGDATNSAMFYNEVVQSPAVLRATVDASYESVRDGRPVRGTLADIYGVPEGSAAFRREEAVRLLKNAMSVTADPMTGIVKFTVTAATPATAAAISRNVLNEVNNFSIGMRQVRSTAERDFARERLVVAAQQLRSAEEELRSFLQRNRQYENDPSLVLEHDRLTRTIGMRQDVFTSLNQRAEQAGLDAARSTPAVSVLEEPIEPVRPTPRRLLFKVAVAAIGSTLLVVALVIAAEFMQRMAAIDPAAYQRFTGIRDDARGDVERVLFLGRRRSKRPA